MQALLFTIDALCALAGWISLVCWIKTLLTMARDKERGGLGHALAGLICGLYALYWGWIFRKEHGLTRRMALWTGLWLLATVLNAVALRAVI